MQLKHMPTDTLLHHFVMGKLSSLVIRLAVLCLAGIQLEQLTFCENCKTGGSIDILYSITTQLSTAITLQKIVTYIKSTKRGHYETVCKID